MYVLLFAVWFIFNGKVNLEITCFGLVIVTGIYIFMCKCMDFSPKKDIRAARKLFWGIKYGLILFWEIVKANVAVTKLIMTSREELEPAVVCFKSGLESKTARVILANSITLTPGTITASLRDDDFEVHCVDKSLAVGLADSVFVQQLRKLDEK